MAAEARAARATQAWLPLSLLEILADDPVEHPVVPFALALVGLPARALPDEAGALERPPYQVVEGGSRICFVRDPDDYRIELIERR